MYRQDSQEKTRKQESKRRRNIIEGTWEHELREFRRKTQSVDRVIAEGPGDLTKNVARSLIYQLATLYDREPSVSHEDDRSQIAVKLACEAGGLWPLRIRAQRLEIAQREGMMLCRWRDGAISFEHIPADRLSASCHHNSDVPTYVEIDRTLMLPADYKGTPKGNAIAVVECYDIRDTSNPIYKIKAPNGDDLTSMFAPGYSGYVWTVDGVPFIPGVLYHAEKTGRMFDPYEGIELFHGTLQVASLYTGWVHLMDDCSWPQRYVINARPAGSPVTTETPNGYAHVPLNRSSILRLENQDDRPGTTASAGQWTAGGDPVAHQQAISDYIRNLAIDYGVAPGDIRRESGNAQSGFAIELSRDGIRAAQRRYMPEAKRGDESLMAVIAKMLRALGNMPIEVDGYTVNHKGLPLSIAETKLAQEDNERRVAAGTKSIIDVYMEQEGVGREEAIRQLRRIQEDNAEFNVTT